VRRLQCDPTAVADRLGVGVVGASPDRGWAAVTHIPALQALPGVELTAVCTTRIASAREAALRWNVPNATDDARALALLPDVDLVAVCVKVPDHRAVVTEALRARKHVYCEWPLGRNAEEGAEFAALAGEAGVVATVGLQGRVEPAIQRLRELVAEGFVGRVLSATLYGTTQLGGPRVPKEHAYTVDVETGVNVLTVPTAHAVDALCYCLGEPVDAWAHLGRSVDHATVIETGETLSMSAPDQVSGGLVLAGGVVVTFHVQGGTSIPAGFTFEVYGDEGRLSLHSAGHLQRGVTALSGARGDHELAALEVVERDQELPDGPAANVGRMYRSTLSAIRNGGRPAADFGDGVRLHRLIDALISSAANGRHVPLLNA
jgi:predicted dehydrogenase